MTDEPVEHRRKRRSRIRNSVEYGAYVLFSRVVRLLGERNLQRMGALLGALAYRLVGRRPRLALLNLTRAFPDMPAGQRDGIVRACWRHFCTMVLMYARDTSLPFEQVSTRSDVVGREDFEAALAGGRAVLLISAHFGSWEAALPTLTTFGRKVTVVGRLLDNPKLQERLFEGRTRGGVELLDRRNAARELIRAINEKAIVVLLVDQAVQSKEGEKVPFLGQPAWTTTSPARLALKYKVPIATVFAYPPQGDRRGRLEFEPAIHPDSLAGEEASPARITERVNDRISARIRRDPHLWLWFHDRFKEARDEE
jgi:Kdo2-lipid IVA lauroyltransferase/acyltransferase